MQRTPKKRGVLQDVSGFDEKDFRSFFIPKMKENYYK